MIKFIGKVLNGIFQGVFAKPFFIISKQLTNIKTMQNDRKDFLKERSKRINLIKSQRSSSDEVI
jgi:hypothetical protein